MIHTELGSHIAFIRMKLGMDSSFNHDYEYNIPYIGQSRSVLTHFTPIFSNNTLSTTCSIDMLVEPKSVQSGGLADGSIDEWIDSAVSDSKC